MSSVTLKVVNGGADSASNEEASGFVDLLLGQVQIERLFDDREAVSEVADADGHASSTRLVAPTLVPHRPSRQGYPAPVGTDAEPTTPGRDYRWNLARGSR